MINIIPNQRQVDRVNNPIESLFKTKHYEKGKFCVL